MGNSYLIAHPNRVISDAQFKEVFSCQLVKIETLKALLAGKNGDNIIKHCEMLVPNDHREGKSMNQSLTKKHNEVWEMIDLLTAILGY